jgi:hypothetical protein
MVPDESLHAPEHFAPMKPESLSVPINFHTLNRDDTMVQMEAPMGEQNGSGPSQHELEGATPPDTLSAPTPELAHMREEDMEMTDAQQSQGSYMSQEAFDYQHYGQASSSKGRVRSRSRINIRYSPYVDDGSPVSPVAPKQSKMTGRPQMSYAELITDAICESDSG